jgi:hypothetical protein
METDGWMDLPLVQELMADRERLRAVEARNEVLNDRCERLFAVATALRDAAMTAPSGIDAQIRIEEWQTFTHDLAVLWRQRVGERIVEDAGIYLDG